MQDQPHGGMSPGPTKQTQDRRITDLILELMTSSPTGKPGRNTADPFRVGNTTAQSLDRVTPLIFGVVVHSIPYYNWYKVQTFESGFLGCCMAQNTSTVPMGVHQGSVLPPNTAVLVYKPPHLDYGIILCALPPLVSSNGLSRPDYLTQGGRSGIRVETAHQQPIRGSVRGGGVLDFSCGSPLDATSMEFSLIAETGVAFMLDPFQAFLRINEHCGLFLNLFDSYTRLIGVNLDIMSHMHEQIYKNDEGEHRGFLGVSTYPWEAYGNFKPGGGSPHVDIPEIAVQSGFPAAGSDHGDDEVGIRPFNRYQEYSGYLGQGGLRVVCAPPGLEGFNTTTDPVGQKSPPGLFCESIGLDGAYLLRSAKSVTFLVRGNVVIPHPDHEPESSGGDKATGGYRASGYFGTGEEHKVGDIKGIETSAERVNAIHEFVAYACNWKALHPFYYHTDDFSLLEEFETTNGITTEVSGGINSFQSLANANVMDYPQPAYLKIDHRYGEVAYYQRQAMFSLQEDGSIVLGCGYGGRLAFTGGKLRLDSAGDIEIVSGGNVVLMGKNVITQAANSVDVNATAGDLRLSAGANMQTTADSVLLEARSTARTYDSRNKIGEDVASSGIILRSAGDLSLLSDNMYLRSGITGDDGSITIDAAKRRGTVRIEADNVVAATVAGVSFGYGTIDQPLTGTHKFGSDVTIIPSNLFVTGSLDVVDGSAFISGSLSVGEDVAAGRRIADSAGGMIGKIPDTFKQLLNTRAAADRKLVKATLDVLSANIESIDKLWRQENLPGNEQAIKDMTFSFRDVSDGSQYRTSKFEFLEPRWLQTVRLGNVDHSMEWPDGGITYQGEKLYPWPGRRAWVEEGVMLRTKKATFYDPRTGTAVTRSSSVYKTPDLSSTTEKVKLSAGLRTT